jgi:hypothetical protein
MLLAPCSVVKKDVELKLVGRSQNEWTNETTTTNKRNVVMSPLTFILAIRIA